MVETILELGAGSPTWGHMVTFSLLWALEPKVTG